MIAKDLDRAYVNFDPHLPGHLEFYVERKGNPLGEMRRALLRDNFVPPKFLFSGHRGSGKSTELSKLMESPQIQEKYFIIHYSVREILDIAALDYIDLLLSIGAQIFIKATDDGELKLRKGLLDELNKWRGIIEEKMVKYEGAEVKTEAGLKAFFLKVQGTLKLGFESRKTIRQTIEPRLSELISIINSIVAEVELKTGKKILVAVDDMDKPILKVARAIFYERQDFLTQPNCSIIYTIPIGILYSPEAGQVKQAFTDSHVLPNVTLTKRDGKSPNEKGRALMKEFVLKRMASNLIEDAALQHAITISGGVFREMARIIRMVADNAIARGEEKIEKQDVKMAESELRNEFRRMLQTEDYEELKKIYQKRELKGSEICAKLLHNLSILEYQNDENWCNVHPAIIPLIEEEENDPGGR